MKLPSRSGRRSEEIRRRRMMISHESSLHETISTASRRGSQRGAGSLLERALGRKETRRRTPAGSSNLPPVMGRSATRAAARPASKQGRRLRSVSLGAFGAEMSLPSLPQARVSWRAASFVLLVFIAGALYFMWSSPRFQVQAPEVHGLKRLTRGDVTRVLALRNATVVTLDETGLQEKLLTSFPEFSSASVSIDLPNSVVITVTERVPVLVWLQDSRSILVDEQGMTFQARDDAALSALPVVKAAGPPPPLPGEDAVVDTDEVTAEDIQAAALSREVVKEFRPTAMFLPEPVTAILELAEVVPSGAELIYEPAHGFGWQDGRGWPVYFGDLANLDIKLNAYSAIVEKIEASGGEPELISVEFIHAPYYRMVESPEP